MQSNQHNQILITSADELLAVITKAVKVAIDSAEAENKRKHGEKIYSKNQVAKKLGKAWMTVDRYCRSGIIRTVPGGGIPESALMDFLNSKSY